MSGHTPGPWKAGKHPHNIVGLVDGTEEVVATVGDMPCIRGHDDLAAERGMEMEQANARLIASAPELLEACRALIETMQAAIKSGDWKVDGACDPDADLARARATLAKATGAAP